MEHVYLVTADGINSSTLVAIRSTLEHARRVAEEASKCDDGWHRFVVRKLEVNGAWKPWEDPFCPKDVTVERWCYKADGVKSFSRQTPVWKWSD